MALVRGASSFWLKETVSTVWDSFFMGRYPDGSNEAFLLTTHLLKVPNFPKFKWGGIWLCVLCFLSNESYHSFLTSKKNQDIPHITHVCVLLVPICSLINFMTFLNWNIIG